MQLATSYIYFRPVLGCMDASDSQSSLTFQHFSRYIEIYSNGFRGSRTWKTILQSLTGLFVVLVGFWIGEALRQHVPQILFRKIVLWAFLIMGIRLVAVALL